MVTQDTLPVIAENARTMTFEEFLVVYAGRYAEWVRGEVIEMAAASLEHNDLIRFIETWLETYFVYQPIGRVVSSPFAMRLVEIGVGREPDVFILLEESLFRLHGTYLDGAADICIEVVSPESVKRDHGEKLEEYEQAGVREYWIFDPIRKEHRFFRLGEDGHYMHHAEDPDGYYRTPLLPGFALKVATLWQEPLPNPVEIVEAVRQMMEREE